MLIEVSVSHPEEIRFETLPVGAVFKFVDYFYMKIAGVTNYNAVTLNGGAVTTFSLMQVVKLPKKAVLHLEF